MAAGGTLAITVSDALVHSGYVSSTTVAEGGVIRFYTEDGTEVGIGRPEMPVLPPTDAAIWAPVEGNDRSFDSGIHWSSGSTPPDGADVSVTAGETGSATIEIWRVQNFGQITVAQDAEITFTLGQHDSGMVVTADTLALADGASVTLPIAAFRPGTVTLGRDAVLRLVGASGIGETFSSVITSDANGRVEVVSGTVTFDQYSTYSGGTLIKSGAVVKVGAIRQVIDNTYCGVLGKMVNANVITIEEGAALDIAGNPDQNYVLNVTGQGIDLGDGTFSGAVFNSGVSRGVNNSQLYGITLADDVMLRADNDFGLVARGHSGWLSIALGEHTLTKTGTNTLLFATNDGMTLSGTGTLSVEEGTLSQLLGVINAGSASLNIGEAGRFSATRDTTFGRIDNAGTFAITASPADATVKVKGDYYGDGRVDKFGQGTSSMNVWNASHGTIYVHEGRHAILGHTPNYGMFHVFNTEEEPNANLKAVVDEGAQFDMNGVPDVTMNVVIAGERADDDPALRGALVNRGGDIGTGKCQVIQLTLATNACVSGVSDYGLIGPGYNTTLLELGEWTMRLYTLKNFWLVNADITGTGTLAVDAGALTFLNKPSRGNDWTLEIGPNAQLVANQTFSVSNLVFRGQSGGGAIVTVFGTYTPDSQTLPNVQLTGPAAGIDVSGMSEPWDTEAYGPLSYSPGTEVTVRLGDRAVAGNEKLLAWREIPAYVTAWRHDLTGSDLKVVARGDGLYLTRSGTVLILN